MLCVSISHEFWEPNIGKIHEVFFPNYPEIILLYLSIAKIKKYLENQIMSILMKQKQMNAK